MQVFINFFDRILKKGIAILFPVFAQSKMSSKKASSISNLKQTGLSTMIYTADYDDSFPSAYAKINGTPQGLWIGAAIGAKADNERYFCGFLRPMVSAPWPPIE